LSQEFKSYKAAAILNQAADPSAQWQAVFDWWTGGGRKLFTDAFRKETGLKIGPITNENAIVAAALPKGFRDLEKKMNGNAFYRAHAQWFLEEMDVIIGAVPRTSTEPGAEHSYANVLRFTRKVLLDSVMLFEDWGSAASVPGVFGIGKNPLDHVMHFYQGSRQTIYGHGTWRLSFADNHSDLATSIIRQLLEIRIRRAFGVMGKVDVKTDSVHPIPLSDILDAVEVYRDHIVFPIRFENIVRINGWANMYLHSGLRSYVWCPPRVLSYLRSFALGQPAPGWSHQSNAGVTAPRATFRQIRSEIEKRHAGEPNVKFKIVFIDEKDCDAILT
jgi:hypothetical protein